MKKQQFYWMLPLLIMVLMVQACGSDQSSSSTSEVSAESEPTATMNDSTQTVEPYKAPTMLEQKKWQLTALTFQNVAIDLVEGSEVFLAFRKGKINVIGACNRFMGAYEETGDNLTITQMAGTKKACPESMGQDSKLIRVLESAEKFEIATSGNHLVIKGASGSLVLKPAK